MQTYIREKSEMASLRVGDVILADREPEGYWLVRSATAGEAAHILHPWECPNCGACNWAEIVVDDGLIVSVTNTPFDRAALERSHYVSTEAVDRAADISGLTYDQLTKMDVVALLRQRL